MNNHDEFDENRYNDTGNYELPRDQYSLETYAFSGQRPQRKRQGSKFRTYVALVLTTSLITSAALGGVLYARFSGELEKQTQIIQKLSAAQTSGTSTYNSPLNSGFTKVALPKGSAVTEIAKKVSPSIVGIRMTVASSQNRFFGQDMGQSKAEGSGVIISKDGYIMTNYHVVQYADTRNNAGRNTTLEVFLPDGRQAKAQFIGGDSKNDLAVIKISLDNLPVAELGDSSALEVGEPAVAIGNPLGMDFAGSVTVGVISALNRKVETEDKVLNLIQTDAAINPGNSGGALVNSQGQVIGINTIKISVAGVEGLGFAIPINDAKPIVDQLLMFGYVKGRPFIGISGTEITEVMARQYNVPVGIYIQDVTAGSGASSAGIKKGDIITALAGKEVKTMKDVDNIKKDYKAGDTVNVTVDRNGQKLNLKLTFSEEK